MGRNAQPRQEVIAVETDNQALAEANAALNTLSPGARDIMANFKLASANPDVLVSEIRAFQASAVEAMFAIGVRLLLLRQISPTAEWRQRLETVGMTEQAARKIVQATIKFNDPRKQRSEQLLTLGKAKLLELLMLDDDSVDVLDAGGAIGTQELDLDAVSRMSPTELRAALREAQAETEAKDQLIAKKDKKLNDLSSKLDSARKFKPSEDAEAQTLEEQNQLDEIASATREVEVAVARLMVVLAESMANSSNEAIHGRALQSLQYVQKRMEECASENGFDLTGGTGGAPAWSTQG